MLLTNGDQLFCYGDDFNLKYCVMGSFLCPIRPLLRIRTDLSVYLHRPKDSTPSEQIEGHLPAEAIDAILDHFGKPCPESIVM